VADEEYWRSPGTRIPSTGEMKTLIATVMLIVLAGVFSTATGVNASPQLDPSRCLQFTNTKALATSRILAGLPLTPELVKEVRSRLSQYNSVRGYPGIADLGLPPDVEAEINRRIQLQVAEWNRYPVGYPCPVFKSAAKTKAFVGALLIKNGFRPSLTIRKTSSRQFQLRGIQDRLPRDSHGHRGVEFLGIVVKTAPRQIAVYLTAPTVNFSQTKRFTTPFEA
jgi:hypothetical protein